ncbi:MAG: LiaF domain-containing protein [Anaerolineaceae bacterium]
MRSGKVFWGLLILLVGFVLLLEPLGILPPNTNVWKFIWPGVLIFLGIWLLVVPMFYKGKKLETESLSIPLGSAAEARLRLKHGAGQLNVSGLDSTDTFLTGEFGGGVDPSIHQDGQSLRVKLRTPSFDFPIGVHFEGLNWQVKLNRGIATRLDIDSGASETNLHLRDLNITELNIDTGASSTTIDLPAQSGYTRVHVESGAASVVMRVPENVAARIEVESGLAGIDINQSRFPRVGRYYESAGYAEAANKAEIIVKTGVGSLEVR